MMKSSMNPSIDFHASPPRLRLLLVEDDPTSRAFLAAALAALPACVDEAESCAQARSLVADSHHDLWLIDANLPDGHGADLLAELRKYIPNGLAVAHTASREPAAREALFAAGFIDVLVKPMPAANLQAAVKRLLSLPSCSTSEPEADEYVSPVWDDAVALSALNGESANVRALRGLFRDELPAMQSAIHAALDAGDRKALSDTLHRLDASCGFVGATRLARIVQTMRHEPTADGLITRFDQAIRELLVVV